ncbi:hypothetical protein conserved [Leishmania donovani]|uniref:Uncharacterized protein n=3 Tax=Leishmania donovani species complex TaxID=38574 RepID=A4HUJ2_LEIIN|nr:conserved hypothetical protein [Leishmania infantum JPCM5]CAJ1986766.1 hypothetical protein conserved [Leishmania donovani]CAM66100.1 conserved hypothetical protein [Leishmania infantum JPCM5]|eukprot:XP_001463733.1 conserved hypothetical protein [Leishmania infantum JPCM5]
MLRRGLLQAAAAAAATAAVISVRYSSSSSKNGQLWITVCCGTSTAFLSHPSGGRAMIRVPLELAQGMILPGGTNTRAASTGGCGSYHPSALHASRVLLALRSTPPHSSSSAVLSSALASAGATHHIVNSHTAEDERGPFEVTIDEVLLHSHDHHRNGAAAAVDTVADLVRLLVDPDLEVGGGAVEAVSLRDFAAMTRKRKLRAVGGDAECLEVLLNSERYQSEKDARELRLRGVATLGQWKEQPDRVQLSAYTRGVLETAYSRLARHRHRSQTDEVMAWLTRAIQRAVADELMAPKRLTDGAAMADPSAPPYLVDVKASAVRDAEAAMASTAAEQGNDNEGPAAVAGPSGDSSRNEVGDESVAARRRGPRQRPVVSGVMPKASKVAALEEDGVAESEEVADMLDENAEEVLEEGEEMVPIMEEERPARRSAASRSPQPSPAAAATPAGRHGSKRAPAAAPTAPRQQQRQPPPSQDVEAEVEAADVDEDDEELVEEVEEEVEEAEEEEAAATTAAPSSTAPAQPSSPLAPATAPAPPAAAATAAVGATAAERRERLVRLAELMMKQFNTADGYLHPTNKAEREAQEQQGDILVLDEDTAQVDPLAMFSTYHAATITDADPVGVRALKTIWTSYNKHQMALEEATDDAAVEFYKRESVNALLYGSVLMRALAREEQVVVLEGTPLPPYGFPLVSSDTRPFAVFAAAGASSSSSATAVTDMTPGKVLTAVQAYKMFFNSKEKRYSPFRPAIDQSAGCSVVRLSGTTLHLYYTSTKDHIIEEDVRLPFAEVMLGVLHLLRHKVLPRVNVVHYHLIATKMADPSDSTDFMLRSTATIDLTNPFTKEELARLRALATPLGMADEMDEYRCIDDLVMDIEDSSGASVVHSLLHNREDLEATLTATLAQLLPEDGDRAAGAAEAAEDAEEKDEEDVEVAAPPPPSRKARGAAAAPASSPSHGHTSRRRAVPEDDEEDTVRVADEQAAEAVPARTSRGKHRQSAGTPLPTAAAAAHASRNREQEEAVLEEAIYNQWQQQRGTSKTGAAAATTPKSMAVAQHSDDDRASAEEAEEDFDEEYEEVEELQELEEAEKELPPARASARSSLPSASAAAGAGARARGPGAASPAPPASQAQGSSRAVAAVHAAAAYEEEYEEDGVEKEEEEDEEMEVVVAPTIPRAPAGRRAVPVAAAPARPSPPPTPPSPEVRRAPQKLDDDEKALQVRTRRGARRSTARARALPPAAHEDVEETAATAVEDSPEVSAEDADEDQWFKKRPKRRYFQ